MKLQLFASSAAIFLCLGLLTTGLQAQSTGSTIPDEIALVHLFRVVQSNDKEAAGLHTKRVNAYLASMKLGVPDRAKLLARANQFQQQEAVLAKSAAEVREQLKKSGSSENKLQLQDLSRQRFALLTKLMGDTMGEMTPAGAKLLREHLDQKVKPSIRVLHP
jgi:hypothetical protein